MAATAARFMRDIPRQPTEGLSIIMQTMSTWEMVALGALALLVLFWAGPGVKAMLEQSRQAQERDWAGLLIPLLLVVAFVLLLMKLV